MSVSSIQKNLDEFDLEWYRRLEQCSVKEFNRQQFEDLFTHTKSRKSLYRYSELKKFTQKDCLHILSLLTKFSCGVLYLFKDNIQLFERLLRQANFKSYQKIRRAVLKTKHSDYLFSNRTFLKSMHTYRVISNAELQHLLNSTPWSYYKINALFRNKWLVKKCLMNFLIDKASIDEAQSVLSKYDMYKNETFFSMLAYSYNDFIFRQYYAVSDKEAEDILSYAKKYQTVCKLSYDTKELKKIYTLVLKNNIRFNILKQIVENNLQNRYDFNELKKLITKDDKKKKLKLNF